MKLSSRLGLTLLPLWLLLWLGLSGADLLSTQARLDQQRQDALRAARTWLSAPQTQPPRNWLGWQLDDARPQRQVAASSPVLGQAVRDRLAKRMPSEQLRLQYQGHSLQLTLDQSAELAWLEKRLLTYGLGFLWLLLSTFFIQYLMRVWLGRAVHRLAALWLNDEDEASASVQLNELSPANDALVTLKSQWEELHTEHRKRLRSLSHKLLKDEMTNLGNRRAFNQRLAELLKGGEEQAGLILLRASLLSQLNKEKGYLEGDKYINDIAASLKALTGKNPRLWAYRLTGGDFALLQYKASQLSLTALVEELFASLSALAEKHDGLQPAQAGLVRFSAGQTISNVLARADTALSLAQTQASQGWFLDSSDNAELQELEFRGSQRWRQALDGLLSRRSIALAVQRLEARPGLILNYNELLARCYDSAGKLMPTATVMAMAERLGMVQDLDKQVVDMALKAMERENRPEQLYAINLNPASIHDHHFVAWLERRLVQHPKLTKRISFEVSEAGLARNVGASQRFIDMAHRMGTRITVERFGTGLSSFRFFRELKPDFIKIDASLSRDIHKDNDTQYYLRMLVDVAHRLGIKVLAENVETLEEKLALSDMRLDGLQGYYLAKPAPFSHPNRESA
ncbi:EAL domain-containing protein [Gallaecimonas sp. GXIMD4217]|uniref:EAL domain-containing protein n=1 Tax=Gallaecimonas sp. GXIMD4217 TaxID=3131927 RepID=UPI00311AF1E3